MFIIRTVRVNHPHDVCGASAPLVRSINTTIERESKTYYGDLLVFILPFMWFALPL